MFDNKKYSAFLFKSYPEIFDLNKKELINIVLIGEGWIKLVETFLERARFFYLDNTDVLTYFYVNDISTRDGSLHISYEYSLKPDLHEKRRQEFLVELSVRIKKLVKELISYSNVQCEYCSKSANKYSINQWTYTLCEKCLNDKFNY